MEISPADRHKLIKALDQIMEVLEIIVKEDLKNAINSSYENKVIHLIPLFKDSFPYAREEVFVAKSKILNPDQDFVDKLQEHNLLGKPLELKTRIIMIEHGNYLNTRKNKQPSLLRKMIGKCLGGFDILLESLSDCIPGLGAVTEFKKGLEHVTKKE